MSAPDQINNLIFARKKLHRLVANEIRAGLVKMRLIAKPKRITCLQPLRINTGDKT